jgi:hypothetical protein
MSSFNAVVLDVEGVLACGLLSVEHAANSPIQLTRSVFDPTNGDPPARDRRET